MDGFFGDVLLACVPLLIILAFVYLPRITGKSETIKWQHQKIAEYEDRLKKAGATVASLEKEIRQKDRLIDDMVAEHMEQSKKEAALEKSIQRLRAELKKRTDQYNELVDLARESGIIDG